MNAGRKQHGALLVLATVLAVFIGGEGSTAARAAHDGAACQIPQGGERVDLDPADFTTRIDNPYWPMRPGSRWVYRETDPEGTKQRVVVTVTSRTKRIANGITARIVHDAVTEGGKPVEITGRLVRTGQVREHLVSRRGHEGVRERQGHVGRRVVRGRRRRSAGGNHHARQAAQGDALPAGVLRRRG